jgi:paired small multidrug resistance pump
MIVWAYLLLAGVFEMIGVTMMNQWHLKRQISAFAGIAICFLASFLFLSLAMKTLPMSTAYAVWTGIGAAGGTITGMLFYGEPKNLPRLFFIVLVLVSAIGLKLVS